MIMIFGEITTKAKVDYEAIVRKAARDIGFTSEEVGLNCDTMKVILSPTPPPTRRIDRRSG